MLDAMLVPPPPVNEPIEGYVPGSKTRAALKSELARLSAHPVEFGHFIGGKEVRTGNVVEVRAPHQKSLLLAKRFKGDETEVQMAIDAAKEAKHDWARMPFSARASIFLKAADLLATKYRNLANATTMLGQSKTAHQAEIDSACELIDFWRFNVHFAQRLMQEQPISGPGMWNMSEQRPLDGFVLAITPFNFTSIAGNLPTAPAIMGNTVVWKPAESAVLSAWAIMQCLHEAGLPDGVVNMVMGPGRVVGPLCLPNPDLAGVHFTGSTGVFQHIWKTIGNNIASYKCYPRIVGETGGKDFIFVHPSADVAAACTAIVRGAYEFQGQKCSAASRVYVPKSLWPEIKERLVGTIQELGVGDPTDFRNFMRAVIDASAYKDISGYIDHAKSDSSCTILAGGTYDDSKGYFIQPTLVQTTDPKNKLMEEEIFGPVATLWVYDDAQVEEALDLLDNTSPYALTGAVFAQDRAVIEHVMQRLRFAAGNFYINDKPTGAVVGQQPFGGSRASGTNDKAGSLLNMMRWCSPRSIKETFVPPTDHRYPFMDAE
ncbi:MAG: 1-pyrroline-5-carboxylate dehydrogenase [Sorangium cellulosum]|nr:MAG: 1-pyrroline-5-carboxylate dehydrogenase [Sorangium cellulosum]